MSDRAPIQLQLRKWPEAQAEQVLEAIQEHFTLMDWFDEVDRLDTDVIYTEDDATLSTAWEISESLRELGCSFIVTQDAKYEADAIAILHTPELGSVEMTSSNNGGCFVSVGAIDAALAESDPTKIRALLDKATAHAHRFALSYDC